MAPRTPAHAEEAHTVRALERLARRRLLPAAYDYFRSGADAERTLRRNERAFRDYALHYRVLVDVAAPDLELEVFGARLTSPIGIAPTAYHRLADPEGELATARAAERAGALFIVSTLATTRLEDVASAAAGPKWFQLYVHKDRGFTRSLVERAEAAGYGALVLTVDTPLLGKRVRDVENHFGLPEHLVMANLVDAPGVREASGSALQAYVASRHDASLTWRDVDWLASLTKLPIVPKGIVRADDARIAVEHGARGILVSNHGGRQLDGAPATIDALGAVSEAVGDRTVVMMDGGVRWGSDVLIALARGAKLVFLGRPVLWGLAAFGEAGATRVLTLLREDLRRVMALAGCPSLSDLPADLARLARA
jgi:isopentenyl diphosphate isomerase/L-lactate dehydrogenase-like FMN-dependent dehydrogenase